MYQTLHYAPHELGSTFTILIWVLVISRVSLDELTRAHFDAFKEQYQPWYRQHNKAGTANTRVTRVERCLVHAGLLPSVPKTPITPENYFPDLRHVPFQTSAILYMKWCSAKYKPSTIQTARYALVVFLHWFQEHYPDLGRLDDVSRSRRLVLRTAFEATSGCRSVRHEVPTGALQLGPPILRLCHR